MKLVELIDIKKRYLKKNISILRTKFIITKFKIYTEIFDVKRLEETRIRKEKIKMTIQELSKQLLNNI